MVPVPIDNPALHQGRLRTTPHVEGQFAAHVYVSLTVNRRSQLYEAIRNILSDARVLVPSLNDMWPSKARQPELHISLSRPIFLRAHQREDFKRAVRNAAKSQKPYVSHSVQLSPSNYSVHISFKVSFTTLSELTNDEKTRTFLTMDIGAGFLEASFQVPVVVSYSSTYQMRNLCEALSPALRTIRQQEYYPNPMFHASIGWALLLPPTSSTGSPVSPADPMASAKTPDGIVSSQEFPTISSIPQEVIAALNGQYSGKLSSLKDGIFPVEAVTLKIGKETFVWRLASSNEGAP